MYSRVGRGGFGPWKQRQYSDRAPWCVSKSLMRSIVFFRCLLDNLPVRKVRTDSPKRCPLIIASDAQADPGKQPSGGYSAFDPESGTKVGGYCTFSDELLSYWGFSTEDRQDGLANPISVCESAIILVAAHQERDSLRGAVGYLVRR